MMYVNNNPLSEIWTIPSKAPCYCNMRFLPDEAQEMSILLILQDMITKESGWHSCPERLILEPVKDTATPFGVYADGHCL